MGGRIYYWLTAQGCVAAGGHTVNATETHAVTACKTCGTPVCGACVSSKAAS